jgi:LPS-assembly lipoprotein
MPSCFRILALGLVLAAVSACGFRPVYGDREGGRAAEADLAGIEVLPIKDRVGQILHNFLLDAVTPAGRPAHPDHQLRVLLTEDVGKLAVRKDQFATRANLTLTATFHLTPVGEAKSVFRGKARKVASYNIVQSEYATLIAERDARTRAARDLAEDIRTQLAFHFLRTETERQEAGPEPEAAPEEPPPAGEARQ